METTSVYMCFPCYQEFNTLEEVLQHQLTCTAEEDQSISPTPIQTASAAAQVEAQSLLPSVQTIKKELEDVSDPERQATDQPRILYQCGDCDKLFKSLEEWQQHRKEGTCEQAGFKSAPDPNGEPEASESQAAAAGQDDSSAPHSESSNTVQPEPEENTEEGSETQAPETSSSQTPDGLAAEVSAPDDSSPRRRGITKKPKPEPVLLCVDCGSCFGLVSELVSHRKTQHGFEEALHRCSVCGESFLNTTLFLYHRKQHRQKGEETVAVVPEVTPEVYALNNGGSAQDGVSSSSTVTRTFTQPELFFCTRCGESFGDDKGLAKHRKEKHSLSQPLHTCSYCGDKFMNTTQFLYHRLQHRFTSVSEETHEVEVSDESAPGSGAGDTNNKNQPPPAKLLQDWARTPLPHVCPYCGKTFTRRVFLRTHVYSHTGEKLFTCKVCTKSFTNSQSLLRHSMNHTGNKPFCCDVCGKSFSQATTLKRHHLIHSSTEPPRKRGRKPACSVDSDGSALFACPNCPSHFSTEEQLNDHRLLHTSHPFPCPECGEPFKRRKELDLHSLIHQDKQPVTCPHCSSQFINQSVLDIHLQRCPSSEEERNTGRGRGQGRGRSTGQIECDLCGHRCMTQEGLDLHRLSHTGQTPLKCPVRPCRRRFTSNSALEEHVLAHFQGTLSKSKSRPRFRCDICLKEFAYNSTFSVHMRTHTDERPFECSTCGKRFRQLPHLQDHERIHSGLRPFCCWICGKSFSVAARLTEHARTHSGEKPYPCPHCPAAFRSRPNLDKHLRQHGDLPPEAAEQVVHAAEVAHVQKVLEGAKALSSLATTTDLESGTVQTIYVGIEGTSQVVILPSSVLGGQAITVPTIAMEESEITMVETGQSPQHAIEFIVEETV
uniref:C2H2-type domain-containing protein n=1 Tax=Poecilia mexicana TaxID=48701 RepID=A0A3B3WPS1_9TELE